MNYIDKVVDQWTAGPGSRLIYYNLAVHSALIIIKLVAENKL